MGVKGKAGPAAAIAAPIHASVAFLLRDLDRAVSKELARRFERYNVSVASWFVLRCIAADEGLSQRELSQRVQVMEASSVELLAKLEEAGLVTREKSAEDRRRIEVRLSAKGRKLMQELWPVAEAVNAQMLAFATEEQTAQFKRMLRQARAQFD